MEVRLRSISNRIHWSLVLKAAVFALAWLVLPFWLFFLIALYLYFFPLFQPRRLSVPFFTLLLACYLQAAGMFFAVIFGVLFYVIFLVKDLLAIDRRAAYELLALALSFILLRDFYMGFDEGVGGAALWYAFLVAAVLALLIQSFLRALHGEGTPPPHFRGRENAAGWLTFVLLAQMILVGLFLPLDFIYQTILVFLEVIFLVDLLPEYFKEGFARGKVLATSMVVFTLFVLVLSSARWGL